MFKIIFLLFSVSAVGQRYEKLDTLKVFGNCRILINGEKRDTIWDHRNIEIKYVNWMEVNMEVFLKPKKLLRPTK